MPLQLAERHSWSLVIPFMPDIFTTRVAFLSQRDLYIWRDIVNLYIAPMARTKRRNFTNKFKLNAIKLAKRLASNSVAARDFGCSEKNIRDWRRNEHLINAAPRGNRRRPRQNSAKFPAVDLAVCEYIDTRRRNTWWAYWYITALRCINQ